MYLVGLLMQALIVLTNPTYIPKAWQGYLFVVMISSFGLLVNTVLARALPKLEGVVFMLFTLSFLAIVVVLWVLSPRLTAAEVVRIPLVKPLGPSDSPANIYTLDAFSSRPSRKVTGGLLWVSAC